MSEISRREFLHRSLIIAGASTLSLGVDARSTASPSYLVLVELKGGNDGLNTFLPLDQHAYYDLRPKLALRGSAVAELSPNLGLNAVLSDLLPVWRSGEMAVLPGLGYEQPNLSHFRGMDIWYSGSNSEQVVSRGWLSRRLSTSAPADGITLSRGDSVFREGEAEYLVVKSFREFAKQDVGVEVWRGKPANDAMDHLLRTAKQVQTFQAELKNALRRSKAKISGFPKHNFGRQCEATAQLISSGLGVPVIHLRIGGFDTHAKQAGRHEVQLRMLGEGLGALRRALIESGDWSSTLIATFSEFGRRAAENGSGGTDHGAAAAHFVMGGRVQGGVYGDYPSLTDLDERGNLRYTTDFRRLYSTIENRWLGANQPLFPIERFPVLPFLREEKSA